MEGPLHYRQFRNYTNQRNVRIRYLRDRFSPLEEYHNEDFCLHFHVRRDSGIDLVKILEKDLQHQTRRGQSLTPMQQVLIALRFYATGTFQRVIGYNDYNNGGLKMIDIASFTKSLKTVWIKKYLDDSNRGKWKYFFEVELKKYGGKLVFTCNLHKRDISKSISVQDPFLQEILEIWSEINFDAKIKTEQQFLEQHIWHNSLIRIENRPVFYKHLFLHGITKVAHLMTDSRNFLPLADFISTYKIQIQPIKYFGLISALQHHYKTNFLSKEPSSTDIPNTSSETFSETFFKNDKVNRVVYQKLLSSKSTVPVKSQEIKSDQRCSADWTSAYCLAARCTKSTKLVNFQFRFLHRILPTNLFLTKIDIKQELLFLYHPSRKPNPPLLELYSSSHLLGKFD